MKSLVTTQNRTMEVMVGENSPHALMENPSYYSIVLNMLGINQQDIGIQVDRVKHELAVLAKKETYSCKRGFYWVFGVPSEAALEAITTRYRGGVLEIVIPKQTKKAIGVTAA